MNKKIFFILILIILIASILRLWKLGTVPISPDWDEVSLGYNAYSIMHTGRDEYGKFLPIILRSFDDYKPALYAYLTIPSIAIFGLNVFAVRLPSAIFGILTVFAVFFLAKELFKRADMALLSSFLLAISPWHIQFSRIAFESNVGIAFNVFIILFFLKGLKKPILLIISAFLAGMNIYIYQSEKVIVPLLILALIIIFRKELFKVPKKYLIVSFCVGVIIALPLVFYTFTAKGALARAEGVSIFSEKTQVLREDAQMIIQDKNKNDLLGLILDNRRLVYAKAIMAGYLSHFDLNWLFITGDIARHHAPNMGLLYLWELPFLLIGIYCLIFGNFPLKTKLLILSWFLIVPIPASVTSGVPHAVRTLNFLPTLKVFTAIGLVAVFREVVNSKFIVSLFFLFFIFNFLYYLNQYFVQTNYFYASDWKYGYQALVEYLKPIHNKYKKVIVSNVAPMDQSYMFFLFYLKFDPIKYLAKGGTGSGGFQVKSNRFSNFEFRPLNYYEEKDNNILLIGSPSDFPEVFKTIKTIYYPDGSPVIKVVEKN